MDVDGRTFELSPQGAEGREGQATATCSPSMCPTCGDMPLLWTVRASTSPDKCVSCPICYLRVRPMAL
jgi:hypothetical protein